MNGKDRLVAELRVDLNICEDKLRKVTRERDDARATIRMIDKDTQTVRKLGLLDNSHDDNGQDPRQTGTFQNPWGNAR